jgi:hypothetical protein
MKYLLALAFFLVGCEPSEMYPAGAGAGIAGSGSRGYRTSSQPASTPLAPLPMLQDPEGKLEDWTEEISIPFNKDHEIMRNQAENECRKQIQGDPLTQLMGVYQRTKTPNQSNNVKWICQFRSEVSNYVDDPNN